MGGFEVDSNKKKIPLEGGGGGGVNIFWNNRFIVTKIDM